MSESKTTCHHHAFLSIHIQLPLQHTLLETISLILGRWRGSRRRRHGRDGLPPLLMHRVVLRAGIIHPEPYFTDQQPSPLSSRERVYIPLLTTGLPTLPGVLGATCGILTSRSAFAPHDMRRANGLCGLPEASPSSSTALSLVEIDDTLPRRSPNDELLACGGDPPPMLIRRCWFACAAAVVMGPG